MSSLRPTFHLRRPGFSLIEMVVSLSIVSVLLVGMTSAVVLASRALPSNDTPAAATVDSARALHQLRDDLRAATELLNRTATSVTLHLPDRNGDGQPEVITYAWAGSARDPLARTVNGNTAVTVLDNLSSFALDYTTADYDSVFPGAVTTSGEQLLSSFSTSDTSSTLNHELSSSNWIGTTVNPSLPASVTSWQITRALFYGNKSGAAASTITFELRGSLGGAPTATVHDSITLAESAMSGWGWYQVPFTSPTFDAADAAALVLANYGGGNAGKWSYYPLHTPPSAMLRSNDSGSTWVNPGVNDELQHFVYGTYQYTSDDWTLTRQRVSAVEVTLTHASAVATTHQFNIALLNTPEAVDTIWQADFNADPTAFDADQDGKNDWQDAGNFDTANLVDGAWSATDTLRSSPDNAALADPARLDVYLRDTTDNAIGGGVRLRFDRDDSRHACVAVEVNATETGQVVAVKNQTSAVLQTTWVKQTVEANTTVRVTLTTDPANDTVGVAINGEVVGSFAYETTDENESAALTPYTDASNSGVFLDHLRLSTGGTVALTPGAY